MANTKKLEWKSFPGPGKTTEWYAHAPHGTYYVEAYADKFAMYSSKDPLMRLFPSEEAAKVAAQEAAL